MLLLLYKCSKQRRGEGRLSWAGQNGRIHVGRKRLLLERQSATKPQSDALNCTGIRSDLHKKNLGEYCDGRDGRKDHIGITFN
jgi:hypothetical protein